MVVMCVLYVLVSVFIVATCWLIYRYICCSGRSVKKIQKRSQSVSVMIVAGSGGHTTEILKLVQQLGSHYQPRMYIVANTDKMSESKIMKVESEKMSSQTDEQQFHVYPIPRSREVKQSWLTTILSTVYATLYAFPLVLKLQPELILCNGPGTCIPICVAGLVNKILWRPVKIIYVESICRIETLSLSGKILYHLADAMFVQWPSLQNKYPKTKYIGRMV